MATEAYARDARWSAPLILAPCAAAVFGATVWWAAGTTPPAFGQAASGGTQAVPATAAYPNSAAGQRQLAALQRTMYHELTLRHQQAVQLQHRLQTLRAELGHLSVPLPPISGGGGAPVGNIPAPAPAPVAAPAPPAVNTNTGASG